MKKLLLIVTVFTSINVNSQNVNIPDDNFKKYLLNRTDSINTDNDITNISIQEAKSFIGCIKINNKKISTLVGIEAFTNLTKLNISNNNLLTLDISKNLNLIYLSCSNNSLSYIDLSKNNKLLYIDCSQNLIKIINIKSNTNLNYFHCNNNHISSLDVSNNLNLNYFDCINNELLICIGISKNQNNNKLYWFKDNNSSYSNDCMSADKYNHALDNIVYNELKEFINGDYYQGIQIVRYSDGTYDVIKKLY